MTEQDSETERHQRAYSTASRLVREGRSKAEVRAALKSEGIDDRNADNVIRIVLAGRSTVYRQAGKRNMMFGALWCVGGLAVTLATYGAAAGSGGGRYVVAWGAVAFGAFQFLRGILQYFE